MTSEGVPGESVLAAFAPGSTPVRLAGGEGRTFAAGRVVLKAVHAPDEPAWEWIADMLTRVVENGFRLARPVRAQSGAWVVDGWTAFERVAGTHRLIGGPWIEIVALSQRFTRALATFPRPDFIDRRTDLFARADRAAWGEASHGDQHRAVRPLLDRLSRLTSPVDAAGQLVHGDFAGNLLFAPPLPPAVIDVSPYWRPAGYATAVTVVDAVLWYGGDLAELVAAARIVDQFDQLLLRALLFRLLVTGSAAAATNNGPAIPVAVERELTAAQPIAAHLEARLGAL